MEKQVSKLAILIQWNKSTSLTWNDWMQNKSDKTDSWAQLLLSSSWLILSFMMVLSLTQFLKYKIPWNFNLDRTTQ